MIRKIFQITVVALTPIILVVLLGFAASNNRKIPCMEFTVSVINTTNHSFVDPEKLKKEIIAQISTIEGQPVRGSLLKEIKQFVNKNPYVKKSSVFRTIDGNVTVHLTQREPLLRIFTSHRRGYYIDVDGRLMPLSNNYTARVPVAGGYIFSGYSKELDLNEVLVSKEATSGERLLADLFRLATFISQDPFWSAFIDYIHVKPGNEFELTPKNGAHVVEFGTIDRMEEKFRNLEIFYLNGLAIAGWDKYSRLNVEFRNQVVCSKN